MGVIKSFDIHKNFWERYPQFKYISEFKNLYSKDKSRDKKKSSMLAWAIAMAIDNSEANMYKGMEDSERKSLIATEYLEDVNFDWGKYEDLVESYKEIILTPEEKQLMKFDAMIKKRDDSIEKEDFDTAKAIDNVVKGFEVVIATRKKLEEAAKDSSKDIERVEGDKKESLFEQENG